LGRAYYLTTGVDVFPTSGPSANFLRRPYDQGLADELGSNQNGFGYLELSFTAAMTNVTPNGFNPSPFAADLQHPTSGRFVSANNVPALRAAYSTATLVANPTYTCVLTVAGVPMVPTSGSTYPIIGVSYGLLYSRYPDQESANAAKEYFNFALANRTQPLQANETITQGRAFALLTSGSSNSQANALRSRARNCVNTAI
jgi:ABC-type phosphate transport system substrate-binding protein